MGQLFNVNVIQNVLNVEEKMLTSIKNISNFQNFSDIDFYYEEIEKLKLYYKKEFYLISKIPEDIDFYNYLFESLKNSSFGLKDETIVLSRFRNILYNKYVSFHTKYDGVNSFDNDDHDDDMYELRSKLFIRDNLLIEYLKSFDEPMKICDKKCFSFFNRIRLYNIFINKNLFDFWVESGFNFDKIKSCSEEDVIKYLKLSKEDYYYILNDTVSESCANLLTGVFSDVKKPQTNINVQDSFFNFKFLLKKLSTESLQAIKKKMDDVYSSIGKYGLLSEVIESLNSEINNRNDIIEDENKEENVIDPIIFDKIINLIKLEDKIFELYKKVDFDSLNNDLSSLNKYILLEKDLVGEINFSSSMITILNDLLNNSLWIYLTGDVDEKIEVISQRIINLLPFYKDLRIIPSQSEKSYDFIYKNHLIRSLNNLWELKNESEDEVIRNGFEEIYKYYFFINPELTDDFLLLNGNHSLLFDLSSDLSGLDVLEYEFDQNEQLYNLGCDVISFIFDNEDKINSVLDYSLFQFKINELMDIISNLSFDYNRKLYKYLNDYSSFFSPLRRDIRKIFKEEFGKSKVKTNNK